jgi:hypothetical protein
MTGSWWFDEEDEEDSEEEEVSWVRREGANCTING